MFFSTFQTYVLNLLSHVPWSHWVIMVLLSLVLTVILMIRKRCSVYGSVAIGLASLVALFLIDTAVVIRVIRLYPHWTGSNLTINFNRILHGTDLDRVEFFSNIAVFVPFGFFVSESFTTTKQLGNWRRFGLSTFVVFALSFCIECLQLALRVGYFEVMDIILNTLGGFVGASVSVVVRTLLSSLSALRLTIWDGSGKGVESERR